MTWTEVKIEGYDFCLESGNYQVRRKSEQVGMYFLGDRFSWCDNVAEGMFRVWLLELAKRR